MKRRNSIIAILTILAIALFITSCSQDSILSLGNIMTKMSGNVYGIKADLRKSEAAVSNVDSVAGTDEVDLSKASDVISSVKKIQGSIQNVDNFKESMSQTVSTTSTALDDAKGSMTTKLGDPAITGNASDKIQKIGEVLSDVVDSITGSTGSITRGDIVTLSAVSTMVDALSSYAKGTCTIEEAASVALDSLAVLKISTDFSKVNIIGDIDLSSIIGNLTSRDVSRAEDGTIISVLGTTAAKITELCTENGEFNADKYNKMVMEAKSIKSAYEMAMMPHITGNVNDTLKKKPGLGMTIDDLVSYFTVNIVTALDGISALNWTSFLGEYLVGNNVVALLDLKNKSNLLSDPTDILQDILYDFIGQLLGLDEMVENEAGNMVSRAQYVKEDIVQPLVTLLHDSGSIDFLMDLASDFLPAAGAFNSISSPEQMQDAAGDVISSLSAVFGGFGIPGFKAHIFSGTLAGIAADAGLDTIQTMVTSFVKK